MRQNVGIILGIIVVFAAMATLWIYLRGDSAQAALRVYEVDGTVKLTTALGDELPASVDRELSDGDRLATGVNSRVVLALGEETRMRLGPTSSVQVKSVDETGVKLELEDGMLSATVRPGSGAVRIGNNGREVVAEDAEFEVGVYGEAFQARASEGSLTVVGTDVTRVEPGEQVTAVGTRARVGPVPEELLLNVDWPQGDQKHGKKKFPLPGLSVPGARIVVTGPDIDPPVETQANDKGEFVAMIPLIEGRRPTVTVEAFDALGRSINDAGILPLRDTQIRANGGPDYQ